MPVRYKPLEQEGCIWVDDLNDFEFPEDALERLEDDEFVQKQLAEGKTYQEILGYSDEEMEKFYQVAVALFQKEKYEKAADAFVFLTTLNPRVYVYWMGLGMCEQVREEYENALIAYEVAIETIPDDPSAYYYAGICHLRLEERLLARENLKEAIYLCKQQPQNKALKESAEELLKKCEEKD